MRMHRHAHQILIWIGLAVAAQSFTGCASIAAYQVGRRSCNVENRPVITEFRGTSKDLYITYDCQLSKKDRVGLGGDPAGDGKGVAHIRTKDLFEYPYGAAPVELGPDRFNFHGKIPVVAEGDTPKTCLFVTGSDPNFLLHLYCSEPKRATSLDMFYPQMKKGFDYRTIWGYAALPVLMPVAFAVDIVATPLYVAALLSLRGKSLSLLDLKRRTQPAHLIAYDWMPSDATTVSAANPSPSKAGNTSPASPATPRACRTPR